MIELKNSKQTYLGKAPDGRDRFALDCTIGAKQMRLSGRDWEDIDPIVKQWSPGLWGGTNTPYRLEIDKEGGRRIYPDKTDLSKYIHLPTIALFKNLTKRIEGNRIIASAAKFDVIFTLTNSGIHFSVLIKEPLPIDRITLDVDSAGFDLLRLLKSTSGMGIPRPRLIEQGVDPMEAIERPLDWSFKDGQLELGFDLTGMRFPVLLKNTTLDLQVAASADDAHERIRNDLFDSTANQLLCNSSQSSYGVYYGGVRFTGVTIKGETISVAYLTIVALSTDYDDPNVNLSAEDVDNAVDFSDTPDVVDRVRTTASVQWTATGIGASPVNSPSIVSVVQELADRGAFGDNAAVFFLDGKTDAAKSFNIISYDGDTTKAAKLHIEYTAGAAGWAGGDVSGVALAAIAKINGVAKASIVRVNGV